MDGAQPVTSTTPDGPGQRTKRQAGTSGPAPSPPALEFPGCAPRYIGRSEIETYEGRLEFWDARTETAWVCEPTTPYHEEPSQTLSGLCAKIAAVRGSPIKCYGSMDLRLRDAKGKPRAIMQADQSVYLHPLRAKLPGSVAMVVGEHDFPDLVLEVDHTTDARRSKLGLYEAWGFPEVWIQVPDRPSASRSKSRVPGLTIHLLEDGVYRVSDTSRAFPTWTEEEIQAALHETTASVATHQVLERVGAALGAREGTGPDDDPLLRSQRRQAMAEGIQQGIQQGIAKGLAAERRLLRRLAERKFGAATAAELAKRLDAMADPARLAEVGEHVIDCATGDALLARVGDT